MNIINRESDFISGIKILQLPKILDDRGNLTFIEGEKHIPFKIIRTYWIYDVPGGEIRGGHAYKTLHEFIVAISGSFDVVLDDSKERKVYSLNRSYYGLYVPKMIWRQLENFSTNALCLILASDDYHSEDYIYDYHEFKQLINAESI
jgi:dTDP-4-dehydrorhamnose 3,5-epimerase-like enzyme